MERFESTCMITGNWLTSGNDGTIDDGEARARHRAPTTLKK